jgi:hypothetical protein
LMAPTPAASVSRTGSMVACFTALAALPTAAAHGTTATHHTLRK